MEKMRVDGSEEVHSLEFEVLQNGPVDSRRWLSQRWWAINGEGELCKWKPDWCCSVGKSGGHLNIQPQGQRSNSFPPQHATQGERKWQNGKESTGKNLHFNVPVGITLDKSWECERPRNPMGWHQTTCNSRHPENNILHERKSLRNRKRGEPVLLRVQNKFRSSRWSRWENRKKYFLRLRHNFSIPDNRN